jgi:hypothetical protein
MPTRNPTLTPTRPNNYMMLFLLGTACASVPETAYTPNEKNESAMLASSSSGPVEPVASPASAGSLPPQDQPPRLFPIGDFCDQLGRLMGVETSLDACMKGYMTDLDLNLDAMFALHECTKTATAMNDVEKCTDVGRNGKSPSFAYVVDLADPEAVAAMNRGVYYQFNNVWTYSVLAAGNIIMPITAKSTTKREEALGTCMPAEGWETVAARLAAPTKTDWMIGLMAGHVKDGRPALASCWFATK